VGRLRAAVEYIEEHLDASPSLEQIAAVARLSPYHFARQFKAATGLPPHQYVLARRVEGTQRLLLREGDLSLAEIAARAGFSDQSQFSHRFKRVVGITPRQFRMSARIGQEAASRSEKPDREPLSIPSGSGRVSPELRRCEDRSDRPAPHGVERCRREPCFAGNASFSEPAQIAPLAAAPELPGEWGRLLRHSP
jgi:AraC-like DNA-binding protein